MRSPTPITHTTARKRADSGKGRQFSSQPKDVAAKTAPHRRGAPIEAELMAEARRRDIPGRPKMDKAALAEVLAR